MPPSSAGYCALVYCFADTIAGCMANLRGEPINEYHVIIPVLLQVSETEKAFLLFE